MPGDVISECLTDIANSVGKIVGFRLATGLIAEPLDRTKAMYKEVKDVKVSGSSINVIMKPRVPSKKKMEILETFLSGINEQYSTVIGAVTRTLIHKSLERMARVYGKEHPRLEELMKEY